MKVVLTSEIKNPFSLLSHPFGGWPREKQLSEEERDGETEGGIQQRRVWRGIGKWNGPL